MSTVNLEKRITTDWDSYNKSVKSSGSKIYIKGDVILENVGPASINLTVGNQWYDCSKKKYYAISDKGVKVKPGKTILIETEQEIAMPYNVFGVVYGTGRNIFKGGFVSSGKINPGFHGHLKIGYYNGSNSTIVFEPKDLLSCAAFFDIETTLDNPLEKYLTEPEPEFENPSLFHAIARWVLDNWEALLSLIVSILAIIFATNGGGI